MKSTSIEFCIICNKEIKSKQRLKVVWSNAFGKVVSPEIEPPEFHEFGKDYGLQYIGSECAKKYPKNWILKEVINY